MNQKDIIREEVNVTPAGSYDVVVVGGGVAGCAAALAAARMGRKVLLLEQLTMLGGLATAGHIVIYLPLCDGYGHQIIGGIAEEMLRASIRYSYGEDLSHWQADNKRYETKFNGPVFALVLEEMLLEAGVKILYSTLFAGTLMQRNRCKAVVVENKSGRQAYFCSAVVDATGDAEVLARLGLNCPAAENSLAIWCYCTQGGEGHILKRGGAAEYNLHLLTLGNIDKKADKHIVFEPYFGNSAEGVNRFILDGHKRLLDLVKNDPKLVLASLPSMPQFRMSRRIEGAYTLSDADLGHHFEDNIGATGDWRRPAPVYEIPYRTLYTPEIANVLAAGRCISVDGEAWQVTRVIPSAAVTGEAAGVSAAIAAEEGIAVQDIPVSRIRDRLASVGGMLDINKGD